MPSRRTWSWPPAALLPLLLAIAMGSPALAQVGMRCPDGARNTAPVDVVVIGLSGVMQIEPQTVSIRLKPADGPNRVCWVAVGLLDGYMVQLEGLEGEDGPFPSMQGWLTHQKPHGNSGPAVKAGSWRYQAILRRPDAEPVVVGGLTVVIEP